jgi:hypothetical protein
VPSTLSQPAQEALPDDNKRCVARATGDRRQMPLQRHLCASRALRVAISSYLNGEWSFALQPFSKIVVLPRHRQQFVSDRLDRFGFGHLAEPVGLVLIMRYPLGDRPR